MLVSWIIPLYNCKEYIGACIESILSLGLDEGDFEIIVVNDGSTDGGEKVVQQYVLSRPNVHLFSQPNSGVSAARNLGVQKAKGDYINFVDSDDRVLPTIDDINNAIFEPMRTEEPDIVVIDFSYCYTVNSSVPKSATLINIRRSLKEQCAADGFSASTCTHYIRRDIIEGHNLKFHALKNGEDQLFMLDLYHFPHLRVLRTNALRYMWLQRKDSASHCVAPERALVTIDNLLNVAAETLKRDYLKIYPQEKYDNFILTYQQCAIMISILAAGLPLSKIRLIIARGRSIGIYPIPWTGSKAVKLLSLLSHSAIVTWLASPLYRLVYLRTKST